MSKQNSLIFHPERIPWIGGVVLGGAFMFAIPFLWLLTHSECPIAAIERKTNVKKSPIPLSISLNLKETAPFLAVPDLKNEMSFSYDPPRPDETLSSQQLLIRLKKSAESQRVRLPCHLNLQYFGEKLGFSEKESLFWMELTPSGEGQIEGQIFVSTPSEGKKNSGNFLVTPQECPIQFAQEFPEGSPFRLLAESRWLGRDLFRIQYEPGNPPSDRLEIGIAPPVELLELGHRDYLVWNEGKWRVSSSIEEGRGKSIARIESNSGKNLILEGWDMNGHVRICLSPPAGSLLLKGRGEDFLTAIRIRSERQISCMLEKQCLILKTGDWVVKTNGRWKVLRKKEEREALLSGKILGEIFALEEIHLRQGQKVIQGRLFNLDRSQSMLLEIPAQSTHRLSPMSPGGEKNLRRGKAR